MPPEELTPAASGYPLRSDTAGSAIGTETARSIMFIAPRGSTGWEDRELLRLSVAVVRAHGWAVGNLDVNASSLSGGSRWFAPLRIGTWTRALVRQLPHFGAVHLFVGPEPSILAQAILPVLAARFFGRRLVVDLRHSGAEIQLEAAGRVTYEVLRRAERVLVSSDRMAAGLSRRGIQALAVGPIVDIARFASRKIRSIQPHLLASLSMSHGEGSAPDGWKCLVRGFELVKVKYPRAELTILISGSFRDLAHLEEELPVGVILRDSDDEAAVDECFARADCFVNPVAIGNPITSVVSALACGLPVLSTKVGIVPEVVTDRVNGMFISPNHPAVLADRVIELVESPELVRNLSEQAAITAAGYASGKTRLTWRPAHR